MRILAADTATSSCSVAISENNVIRVEFTIDLARTHAKSLMPIIDSALYTCGLKLSDIDAFSVTVGPGSFTGLRIGISTLKGLAAATGKPIIGVSTLDALANQFIGTSFLVCPLVDARKGEVYFGFYRWKEGRCVVDTPPSVLPPEKVIEIIGEACLFVGNGALLYEELIRKHMGSRASFAAWDQHVIKAGRVAHLAHQKIEDNPADEVESISPHYIRPSDAERSLSEN